MMWTLIISRLTGLVVTKSSPKKTCYHRKGINRLSKCHNDAVYDSFDPLVGDVKFIGIVGFSLFGATRSGEKYFIASFSFFLAYVESLYTLE